MIYFLFNAIQASVGKFIHTVYLYLLFHLFILTFIYGVFPRHFHVDFLSALFNDYISKLLWQAKLRQAGWLIFGQIVVAVTLLHKKTHWPFQIQVGRHLVVIWKNCISEVVTKTF